MGKRLTTLVVALTIVTMAVGITMVVNLVTGRPNREAIVDGLYLRLDHVEWLDDQMDHGGDYPMPASMMPDLPPQGIFRLNAEAALFNKRDQPNTFQVRELFLRSSKRGMWPATGGEVRDTIRLKKGQSFNVTTSFDIAETEIDQDADLQLHWIRDGKTVRMLRVPHPPDHFHDDDRRSAEGPTKKETEWPEFVTSLPPGNPVGGKELYLQTHGCISCHGHPDLEGSNAIGPHLGDVATHALDRVPGKNATQYLYESIVMPDAYVVESKGQLKNTPSAMPPFGQLLSKQDAADLVAYLLRLRKGKN